VRRMLFNLLDGRVEKLLKPYRDGIAAAAIPGSGGVAFLGDSITHMGRWDLMFPDARAKNFGISGETSAQVLGRLAPVISVRPSLILILIGTNDLFWGSPATSPPSSPSSRPRFRMRPSSCRGSCPGRRNTPRGSGR